MDLVGAAPGVRTAPHRGENEETAGLLTRRFLEFDLSRARMGYCGGTPRRVGRSMPKAMEAAGFVPEALPITVEQECTRERRRVEVERQVAFDSRFSILVIAVSLVARSAAAFAVRREGVLRSRPSLAAARK